MQRIKEWWDALEPWERKFVMHYDREAWRTSDGTTCLVCGVDGERWSPCDKCRELYRHIEKKADRAIVEIAWKYFRQELVHSADGSTRWFKVRGFLY